MILKYCLAVVVICLLQSPISAEEFVFNHERVLGTDMQLRIHAKSLELARNVERKVLAEIDRLDSILSRYKPDSEFSLWQNRPLKSVTPISCELADVLLSAEKWRSQTSGAFDVRTQAFTELWNEASLVATGLTDSRRRNLIEQLGQPSYRVTQKENRYDLTKTGALKISLDGLAKGFILDQVCKLVAADHSIDGCTVNIGGDLRKIGDQTLKVSIVNPFDSHVQSNPLMDLKFSNSVSMATSGDYFRGTVVEGRKRSHIFDPRTGLPVEAIASVTVIAEKAMDADALATAISVLGSDKGLELVEKLDGVACLVVSNSGQLAASTNWPVALKQKNLSLDKEKKSQGLVVNFTLNRPKGRRYRRPYVAVWLEDSEGFPVKTALLFLQTEQPGPRWHRDLTRWYRNDRTRKLVEKTDVIKTIASATRGPGKYSAKFDGKDNQGKSLPDGKYTLCLEVAREHGTYQIIREKLDMKWDTAIPEQKLKSNVEMKDVIYSHTPAK